MNTSLIITLVVCVTGIIISLIFGAEPRYYKNKYEQEQQRVMRLQNELLALYEDASQLIQIEDCLLQQIGQSKMQIRKKYSISRRCQPASIEKRIIELKRTLSID